MKQLIDFLNKDICSEFSALEGLLLLVIMIVSLIACLYISLKITQLLNKGN